MKLFFSQFASVYVLEDNNGRQLVEPRGYNLDVESFIQWLEEGVKAYKTNEQL